MSISVSGKIVKILNCKDSFDFGANSGYIVNNAVKTIFWTIQRY